VPLHDFDRKTACNPHGYVGCLPKNAVFGGELSNSGGKFPRSGTGLENQTTAAVFA
jgi:hypothetical protein